MKANWSSRTPRERLCTILNLLLIAGGIALYVLYFVGVLSHHAKTFAWCLFAPAFFIRAFSQWQTDRDQAVMDILLGFIAGITAVIGFLSYLTTIL